MADPKQQPPRSLNYSIREVATVKAECERFTPYRPASSGSFRNAGSVEVTQVPGTTDQLYIVFERTVTGQPKGEEGGKIAFFAMCRISCIVHFDQDQNDVLPSDLLRQVTTPIFYVATERCRNLVAGMGYPNPAIGVMPALQVAKTGAHQKKLSGAPEAKAPSTPTKTRKRPAAKKPKEK